MYVYIYDVIVNKILFKPNIYLEQVNVPLFKNVYLLAIAVKEGSQHNLRRIKECYGQLAELENKQAA